MIDLIITKNNQIIFDKKGLTEDDYSEILLTLKMFKNKNDYNLFVKEDKIILKCLNLIDIFN